MVFAPISAGKAATKHEHEAEPRFLQFQQQMEKRPNPAGPSPRMRPILSCRAGRSQVARSGAAAVLCVCCLSPAPQAPTQALDPGRMSPENGQAQKTGVETNTMDRRGGAVQSGRVDQQNAISEQTHMGNDRWHSAFPCCPLTSDQGVFRHPFAGKARKRETEG